MTPHKPMCPATTYCEPCERARERRAYVIGRLAERWGKDDVTERIDRLVRGYQRLEAERQRRPKGHG